MGHPGVNRCKALARQSIYWINIDRDIDYLVYSYPTCCKFQETVPSLDLLPHEPPSRPFQRLALDIFHFEHKDYLLMVDYFSKWYAFKEIHSKTAESVIKVLEPMFSIFGIPEEIVADNNPFNSEELCKFADEWDFILTTSSPNYSKSNGLAERHVQTAKTLLRKCADTATNVHLALLQSRSTPIESIGLSPAQIVFRRQI